MQTWHGFESPGGPLCGQAQSPLVLDPKGSHSLSCPRCGRCNYGHSENDLDIEPLSLCPTVFHSPPLFGEAMGWSTELGPWMPPARGLAFPSSPHRAPRHKARSVWIWGPWGRDRRVWERKQQGGVNRARPLTIKAANYTLKELSGQRAAAGTVVPLSPVARAEAGILLCAPGCSPHTYF